ncbi:MAG: hypothetical protein ACPGSB_09075 [Opitutales bacterium]
MPPKLDLARNAQINPIYESMRQGTLRIDIEEVQVVKDSEASDPIKIPAWVSMESDRLCLNLRGIPKQADFEEAISQFGRLQGPTISVRSSDCFQVRAKTEAGIPIMLEGVSPMTGRGRFSYSHAGGSRSHEKIRFYRISFPAAGMDALNSEEHREHLYRACGKPSGTEDTHAKRTPKDEFYAILPDVELRIINGGTETETKHPFFGKLHSSHSDCFTGEVAGCEFCLEKHEAGMRIDFHCPVGQSTPEEARAKFDGLLQAIALIHGCNPWPDYFCHRRDHQVIERWMLPRANLQSQPLRPLSDGDLFVYSSDKGEKLFLAAASFFAKPSVDASRFNKALWLMREACRGDTPQEISVLTLCSVFDGLIKPHRGRKPSGKMNGKLLKQYRWIDPIKSKLGMDFDFFEPAIEYWDTYRNPLAHGFGFDQALPEDKLDILDAYGYLFGAIYRVMAHQIGFTECLPQSMLGSQSVERSEEE